MKKRVIATALALFFVFAAGGGPLFAPAARAAGPGYTATLKYYDGVQLTYTLSYPDGHVWSGGADIPIGGMGGASGQIYCVDPFVPFHSLADSSTWNAGAGATEDTKGGYTAAAPWAVSPAMRKYGDAVRWLVLNGYRGDFLAHDTESQASVTRLQALYPAVGEIDRTVALMATKVAVWKILTDGTDAFNVVRTSLDGSPARTVFDKLVDALCADAKAGRTTGLNPTVFTITLLDESAATTTDDDAQVEYYGPLTVTAEVLNSADDIAMPNMDRAYLSVTGQNLDGVAVLADDDPVAALPTGTTPGAIIPLNSGLVAATEPYVVKDEGASRLAGKWTSQPFYLSVPLGSRPADHGALAVHARGVAGNVVLEEGTPVTFINGQQDWNSVQAFIGGARDGMVESLYAEAVLAHYTSGLGQLYVAKQVIGATPADSGQLFSFEVLHSDTQDINDTHIVDLGLYPPLGADSVDISQNRFTLKNGGLAEIDELPAAGYYWVREVDVPAGYSTGHMIPLAQAPVNTEAPGALAGPFAIDAGGADMAMVSFINRKRAAQQAPKAHLYVGKWLFEYAENGGPPVSVGGIRSEFRIEASEDNGATWHPQDLTGIFSSGNGLVVPPSGAGTFTLESTDVAFIELDPAYIYRVTETNSNGYSPVYQMLTYRDAGDGTQTVAAAGDSASNPEWVNNTGPFVTGNIVVQPNDSAYVAFTNINTTFQDLSVTKAVENGAQEDLEKLFKFQIIYAEENTSLFTPGQAVPLSGAVTDTTVALTGIPAERIENDEYGAPTIFGLRAGETATAIGLPAGNYRVAELTGEGYDVGYTVGAGAETPAGAGGETANFRLESDTQVAFTNTVPGPGGETPVYRDLSVRKAVENGTQADLEKLFSFQIICAEQNSLFTAGQAVALAGAATGAEIALTGIPATRITNDEHGAPTIFSLRAGETATALDLPEGSYRVAELSGEGYDVSYTLGAGAQTPAGAGGETASFRLDSDTQASFINTAPAPDGPGDDGPGDDNPGGNTPSTPQEQRAGGSPATGDGGGLGLWLCLFGAGLAGFGLAAGGLRARGAVRRGKDAPL